MASRSALARIRQRIVPSASEAAPNLDFEPVWPMRLALITAIVLYVFLPEEVAPGPRIVIPSVEGVLLVVLWLAAPHRHHSVLPHVRALALGLVAVISIANIVNLALLCRALLQGSAGSGHTLVLAAMDIYLTNIIAFGFWYWELDRGGPVARIQQTKDDPDFLFPQMTTPKAASTGWRPLFLDYLYVSFTNATAFSPTDTMPLSHLAKVLMMFQSAASLITVALLAARAVNILN